MDKPYRSHTEGLLADLERAKGSDGHASVRNPESWGDANKRFFGDFLFNKALPAMDPGVGLAGEIGTSAGTGDYMRAMALLPAAGLALAGGRGLKRAPDIAPDAPMTYFTRESAPGVTSRHMPGYQGLSEADKAQHLVAQRRVNGGQEPLLAAAMKPGTPQSNSVSHGAYSGPEGMEYNPMLVGQAGGTVDPARADAISKLDQLLYVQNGSPMHSVAPGEGAFRLEASGPIDKGTVGRLSNQDWGGGFAIATGDGVTVPFSSLGADDIARRARDAGVDVAGVTPTAFSSTYDGEYPSDFGGLWSGQPMGSGSITRQAIAAAENAGMMRDIDQLAPLRLGGQANAADAAFTSQAGPMREDVVNVRRDFDEGGLSYLKKMLEAGRGYYPAATLPFAAGAFGSSGGDDRN